MSIKPRSGCTLSVLIGAQALAFTALAQHTPDTSPQRPADRTAPQTDNAASTTQDSQDWERNNDMDRTSMERKDRAAPDYAKLKPVTAQSFATQAAVIGKAEIELAQLALQNTKNEEIRIYAERMVKDHTASRQKLEKIAAQENLQLPRSLDAEQQAVKQRLSGLQGDAFDREYKKHMTICHDKAVALFESASQTTQMPSGLKAFAASTLPTLEKHKALAKSLDAKKGA